MKKTFALIAALSMLSLSAFAQDKQLFNHMAVGPSIGNGLGVEIALPIGPQFQVHVGYSYLFPLTLDLDLSSVASSMGNTGGRDFSSVPVTGALYKNGQGNITFDFFPNRNGSFHLSAGVLIGSGKIVSAKANLRNVLRQDEYGTLGIGPEGQTPISSDRNGYAYLDWKANAVMPFIGLGWGRACNQDRLVNVVFDMGIAYTGKTQFQSYNYIKDKDNPTVVPITSAYIKNKDEGLVDVVTKIPVMPMLKLTVFFRCF